MSPGRSATPLTRSVQLVLVARNLTVGWSVGCRQRRFQVEPQQLDVRKAMEVAVVRQQRVDTVFPAQRNDDGVGNEPTSRLTFPEYCSEQLPVSRSRSENTDGRTAQQPVEELDRLSDRMQRKPGTVGVDQDVRVDRDHGAGCYCSIRSRYSSRAELLLISTAGVDKLLPPG